MKIKLPAIDNLKTKLSFLDLSKAKSTSMYRLLKVLGVGFEPEVSAIILTILENNSKTQFINIGANIGFFPMLAKSYLGENCKCYSIEAYPKLHKVCMDNYNANGLNIKALEFAFSNQTATAPFFISSSTDTSNSLNPSFRKAKEVISVKTETIDSFFKNIKRKEFNTTLLLLDTESTEVDILNGGKNFIKTIRPFIICEVLFGLTETKLQSFFKDLNYYFYRVDKKGLHLEDYIKGDSTYEYKNWLFSPEIIEDRSKNRIIEIQRKFKPKWWRLKVLNSYKKIRNLFFYL